MKWWRIKSRQINLRTTKFTNCFTQNKCIWTQTIQNIINECFILKYLFLCTICILNIRMLFWAINQVRYMNELFLVKNSRKCDTLALCWPLMSQPGATEMICGLFLATERSLSDRQTVCWTGIGGIQLVLSTPGKPI